MDFLQLSKDFSHAATLNNGPSTRRHGSSSQSGSEPTSPAVLDVLATIPPDTPSRKKVHFNLLEDALQPLPSTSTSRTNTNRIRITTDIGIYMDETSLMVGRFNSDINDVEILRHYSAEIAFVNDKTVIGLDAESYRNSRNHFYIKNVMKSKSNTIHTIEFQTGRYSITSKNIRSSFFKQLGSEIMEITRTVSLGNVCLTIPFSTTSRERKRFKTALATAGFLNPRILSSLISTAVAFTKDSNYYLNDVCVPKLIFVAQCLKTSFSVALIEISQGRIVTKSCFGSNNMPECRDGIFSSLNEQLYSNSSLAAGKQEFMLKIYQKAVDQLYENVPRSSKLSGILVVKTSQKSTKLDCLFRDIFGDNVTTAPDIARGPLLGASLLAAKSNLSVPLLPRHVEVYDSCRTNLIYTLGKLKGRVTTENQCFEPREVFRVEVTIPAGRTDLTLLEEYSEDGFCKEICRFHLPVTKLTTSTFNKKLKDSEVILHVAVDINGIYNVHVFPMQNSWNRTRSEKRRR